MRSTSHEATERLATLSVARTRTRATKGVNMCQQIKQLRWVYKYASGTISPLTDSLGQCGCTPATAGFLGVTICAETKG